MQNVLLFRLQQSGKEDGCNDYDGHDNFESGHEETASRLMLHSHAASSTGLACSWLSSLHTNYHPNEHHNTSSSLFPRISDPEKIGVYEQVRTS